MSDATLLLRGGLVAGHGEADVLVQGNRIAAIGPALQSSTADVFDARGLLITPGLVNAHHHLAQSLLKGIPGSLQMALGDWLGAVPYRYWPHFTPDCLYAAARIGFSELLAAGCTLCTDHHYLYHRDTTPELQEALLQAASELGIRLVLCRGIATVSGSHRGMSSTSLIPETLDLCIARLQDLFGKHHDAAADAMVRLAVAPTSLVHTCTPGQLRLLADFARAHRLLLHSHLLEVAYDEEVSQRLHGLSAINYADSVGWLGSDVWFAHLVQTDAAAIAKLGATATGLAHCPTSNSRLGSGIAPVPKLAAAGVRVAIGVDGSAAAESGSLLQELSFAWLLHRTQGGPTATDAAQVFEWGTRGGAAVLGFAETGVLAPGKLADLALYDLSAPRLLGLWQPELAPVLCGEPLPAAHVLVNGRWRVRSGVVLGLDYDGLRRDAACALHYLREVA